MPIMDQDGIRGALRWLSERRLADPAAPRTQLLDEAARRFDLTPLEAEFLFRNWREGSGAVPPSKLP
jgi:hypothetical protein